MDDVKNDLINGEVIVVDSSVINAIWYEAESQVLFIKFDSGKTYAYYSVPLNIAVSAVIAPSVGRYFNFLIKGRYSYNLI